DLARRAAALAARRRRDGRVRSFEDDRLPGGKPRIEDGSERGVLALGPARLPREKGHPLRRTDVRPAAVGEPAAGCEAQRGEGLLVPRFDHDARQVEQVEQTARLHQPLPVEREERGRREAGPLEETAHARRGERFGVPLHGAQPARDREAGQRLGRGEDARVALRAARGAQLVGAPKRRVQRWIRHLPRGVAMPERGGERRGDEGPDVGERQQERERRPRRDAAHEEDGERDGEPGERARGKERQQGGEGDRPGDGLARAEPPAEHAVEARPRERGQGEDDDRAPAEERAEEVEGRQRAQRGREHDAREDPDRRQRPAVGPLRRGQPDEHERPRERRQVREDADGRRPAPKPAPEGRELEALAREERELAAAARARPEGLHERDELDGGEHGGERRRSDDERAAAERRPGAADPARRRRPEERQHERRVERVLGIARGRLERRRDGQAERRAEPAPLHRAHERGHHPRHPREAGDARRMVVPGHHERLEGEQQRAEARARHLEREPAQHDVRAGAEEHVVHHHEDVQRGRRREEREEEHARRIEHRRLRRAEERHAGILIRVPERQRAALELRRAVDELREEVAVEVDRLGPEDPGAHRGHEEPEPEEQDHRHPGAGEHERVAARMARWYRHGPLHFTVRPARAPSALLPLALLGLLAGACRRESATRLVRFIAAPGSGSTAALARAEIAGESRYVLAAHPPIVLRARADVTLPPADELRVPAELPPALAGRDVRIDASVLVRELPVAAPAPTFGQLDAARMVTASAPPLVVRGRDGARPEAVIPLPEELRGQHGLLTVSARPLPASPREQSKTAEVDVPPGARLVFGYGVEEAGWAAGFPPVRFALAAGDATLFERRLDPAADARDRRWFDASLDLSPVAGRRVSLDKSFAVVSSPALVPPAAPARPGIVLVSLDTLRARSVSAYGCRRPTTPALDRTAAQGALVRTAVAPVPFTPPSHMSMLTGLEPCAHGIKGVHEALAPDRLTLAEALRAAGYETAAFTEDAYLIAPNGFDRGFDTYLENRSEESASSGFAAETFAQARAWLAAHAARPFFLFVHTYQVHEPYTPPRAYAALFTDG